MNRVIESFCAKDTYDFGRELSAAAVPGQVYCIDGDLGTGKTVFTQGFAAGLGINDPVSSPTFTIIQEYTDGRLPFYHFDVYRIGDIAEMDEIGYEEYFFGDGVCLIEWGHLIDMLLPDDTVRIRITKDLSKGSDYRMIMLEQPYRGG